VSLGGAEMLLSHNLLITYGAMSRFALQKCSNLAQILLANLLIARVSTRFFVWYNYFKNIYTFLLKKFAGVNICCIFTLSN